MSTGVRDWLPVEALAHAKVRARIGEAVAAWSAQWLARRSLLAISFTPVAGEAAAEAGGWRVYRQAVAVSLSQRASGRLLDWALDAGVDHAGLTRRDRELLDTFEARLLDDLAAKIEAALGVQGAPASTPTAVDAPLGRFGGLVVGVGDEGGGKLLTLAVPLAAAMPACKAALGPAPRGRAKLDSLAGALGVASLSIEAVLGAAEIRLADLRTLAPGDVLVLDTALTGSARLSLAGSGEAFAHAGLTDIDGRMALTLQA